MKTIKWILDSLCGAITIVLMLLTGLFLTMILKGTGGVMKTFYFDSLYFKSIDYVDGGFSIHFGMNNHIPIAVTTVCIFIVILLLSKLKVQK